MGFFRNLLGYDDESSSSKYNASTYSSDASVSTPILNTTTTISKAETPAEAQVADTKEYEDSEKKRKRKNGVRGSFTNSEDNSTDSSSTIGA